MFRNLSKGVVPVAVLVLSQAVTPMPAQAQDLGQVVSGVAQTLLQQEVDKQAYLAAQRTNTIAAYQGYLAQFPKGIYRANAEAQLAKLGVRPTPPVTTAPLTETQQAMRVEAGLGLTRAQRVTIQKQLAALGYSVGAADGLWGTRTRTGIAQWQKDNRQSQTGYLTRAQIGTIGAQAQGKVVTPTQPATSSDAAVEERLLGLTATERRGVQTRLTRLGYSTYGADGVFGRNTRSAIATWQADHAWARTGYLTADQLRVLYTEAGG